MGRHLFARLGVDRAVATYCRNHIQGGVYFDSVRMQLPDIIKRPEEISCAAILLGDTDPEACAMDIKKSQAVNVKKIRSILDYLKGWRIKPVFTSSEFVFDGTHGNYVETDPVSPILTYGRQKVEIEKYIRDNFSEFIILRLAKVYGSQLGDGTIFANWIEAIKKGATTLQCAYNQRFSPVYVSDVVQAFIRTAENGLNGIFHLAGERSFLRIELLNMLLSCIQEYKPVKIKVVPRSIHDFKLREKRPLDVSMRPDKLIKAAGIKLHQAEAICREMVKEAFQR